MESPSMHLHELCGYTACPESIDRFGKDKERTFGRCPGRGDIPSCTTAAAVGSGRNLPLRTFFGQRKSEKHHGSSGRDRRRIHRPMSLTETIFTLGRKQSYRKRRNEIAKTLFVVFQCTDHFLHRACRLQSTVGGIECT